MDHQVLVREAQGLADLEKELQAPTDDQPVRVEIVVDGLALDQFHHEIGQAVAVGAIAVGATVEDPGDVGMLEAGEDLASDTVIGGEASGVGRTIS